MSEEELETTNTPEQNSTTSNVDLEIEPEEKEEVKPTEDQVSPPDQESSSTEIDYEKNITYTEDGEAIFTDPQTKYQYKFDKIENKWIGVQGNVPNATSDTGNSIYENEHYRWCFDTNEWIPKNQPLDTNSEAIKSEFKDGQHTYTDKDGTVFFWDDEKKAWFPKIDDDFMAHYQMNYGFVDNTSEPKSTESTEITPVLTKPVLPNDKSGADVPTAGVKRKPEPPKWFEVPPDQNTKVYVSNLPTDITEDEFSEMMSKCGMIVRDPKTNKLKIKLYTEPDGQVKGDGLCNYIRIESVHLALNLLDGSDLRGNKIKVQRAQFEMRGEYNPALKPKRNKKDKEKIKKMQEKLFDWRPEKMRGERFKHEKVVIIKNMFTPDLFVKDVQLIIDYQTNLREECSKLGTVRKVVIYDHHPEGIAQVNMADAYEADEVILMMNGRLFGNLRITAETWDGKTKYKNMESKTDEQKRLSNWGSFLESGESKSTVQDS